MEKLVFSESLSLSIVPDGNKLRIIVFNGADELVCRKVNSKVLSHFLQAGTGRLFKGRLQMDNYNGSIGIIVKDKQVGSLNYEDMLTIIDK